ncbi:CDC42 small effector protein 1-like [Pundamilia nyererei]|uniref:CDC42 small effector protein 1-like n=1 Tax=Pundamilia nyererei TaxID=303518 RepID=A0A9Y6SJQ2_9CICH|nr:PREDICTED: CDC42 small effector protein 1-like [Pundamilia nyererei]
MPQDYPQAVVPPLACRAAAESSVRPLDRPSLGMSDFWHKMGCCVVAKPPPVRRAVFLCYVKKCCCVLQSGSVQEQMRSKGPNMNGRNSLL